MLAKNLVSLVAVSVLATACSSAPAVTAEAPDAAMDVAQPPSGVDIDRAHAPGQVVDGQGLAGWYPHEGGLMEYRVAIRFGQEPNTMPDGWSFGRVSAVATDSSGQVFVFHRGDVADPIIVFDAAGAYVRSFGRDLEFGNEHGLRIDRHDNVWVTDNGNHQVMKFTNDGELLMTLGVKGPGGHHRRHLRPSGRHRLRTRRRALRCRRLRQQPRRQVRRRGELREDLGHARVGAGRVQSGPLGGGRFAGPRLRQRPREQPDSDLRRQRRASEDVDAPRRHAEHLHHAGRPGVGHHAPGQRREHHL